MKQRQRIDSLLYTIIDREEQKRVRIPEVEALEFLNAHDVMSQPLGFRTRTSISSSKKKFSYHYQIQKKQNIILKSHILGV